MDTIEIKFEDRDEGNIFITDKDGNPWLDSNGNQVVSTRYDDDSSLRYAYCYLNGKKVDYTFDNTAFLRSCKSSEQFMFVCSCGDAGCAGIWNGIGVKVRRYTVEWRIPEHSNYTFLTKKFYSFDRIAYEATRKKLLDSLINYAEIDPIADHWNSKKDLINYIQKSYEGKYWYE